MKTTIAAAAALLALAAGPALAQPAAAPAAPAAPAAVDAASAGKLSVETSKISDIIKNEAAKTALEKAVPTIENYYSQIGEMTLTQVAPMSQGALDEAKLKALQTEFDAIK